MQLRVICFNTRIEDFQHIYEMYYSWGAIYFDTRIEKFKAHL